MVYTWPTRTVWNWVWTIMGPSRHAIANDSYILRLDYVHVGVDGNLTNLYDDGSLRPNMRSSWGSDQYYAPLFITVKIGSSSMQYYTTVNEMWASILYWFTYGSVNSTEDFIILNVPSS